MITPIGGASNRQSRFSGEDTGNVDYLDVLNAQAELLAEQRARALIVARQFLAHAGLMKALGGGYRDGAR
jgi:outer membrane protein TolC